MTTPPKPISIGPAAASMAEVAQRALDARNGINPAVLDAERSERRRKALEQLRRNLLSAAKQVAVLEELEDRKETAA